MVYTCAARPEHDNRHRRRAASKSAAPYQPDDGIFRPPSLRDIPMDHRARRKRATAGPGDGSRARGSCCAAPPARQPARLTRAIDDEWEVWDELMRAVDEAASPGDKRPAVQRTVRVVERLEPQADLQHHEPEEEKEKEKGRFRRLPAIAFPSFPSLFAPKKPEAEPATTDEADAASPRSDGASPSPRDWASQILRVRATELVDARDADDASVVQAVARNAASPVDGAAPVLTATVVAPTTVTIHVDGHDLNPSFLGPQPTRPEPAVPRKPASGARSTLVHQLAELGHTAAAASDYEGAAATFTRALAADPDDRVGLNEEILAAMQDAQRMARAQEEYDLDEAVEASLRDQQAPCTADLAEQHEAYRTEDTNGLCHSPGTPGSSVADSAEGWDWGSLDSLSVGERSIDDISDEDVIVPDAAHGLCGLANDSNDEEQHTTEEEEEEEEEEDDGEATGERGPMLLLTPPKSPLAVDELLLPPRIVDAKPVCGDAAATAATATADDAPDPREAFQKPKMSFTFLTTHEVLDLNEWRNLHDDDTWQGFAGDIRERRGGAYPDEWFDVVNARKDRLDMLRNSQGQGQGQGNHNALQPGLLPLSSRSNAENELDENNDPMRQRLGDGDAAAAAPRLRLRPGCVPWESPSPGDALQSECDDNQFEQPPQAPRAVRRCAFAIPSEESLLSATTLPIGKTAEAQGQQLEHKPDTQRIRCSDETRPPPADADTHAAAFTVDHAMQAQTGGAPSMADGPEEAAEEEGGESTAEEREGVALIWHPQPLTIARKVSSA
jgi:hypothetical protein